MLTRRTFVKSAIALPIGAALAEYGRLSAAARGLVKIRAVKAMAVRTGGVGAGVRGDRGGAPAAAGGGGSTIIKIETDAGLDGYGPALGSGPLARAVIDEFMSEQGSAKGLGLIGKDP